MWQEGPTCATWVIMLLFKTEGKPKLRASFNNYPLSACHAPDPALDSGNEEVSEMSHVPALKDFAFHWGTETN